MDKDKHLNLYEFQLYDSIINGSLRPHLADNNDVKRITRIYQEEVWGTLGLPQEKVEFLNLVLANPYYIRYKDVLMQKDDEAIIELHDEGKAYLIFPDNTNYLIDADIPPATGVVPAYYLFILEKEFDRIGNKFQQVLINNGWSTSNIKNYCNRNLISLKRLAEQANTYSKQLGEAGYNDSHKHSLDYVLWVLKEYIVRSIILLQEIFEPYLKVKPLKDVEIKVKYFEYTQKISRINVQTQKLDENNRRPEIKREDSIRKKTDTNYTSLTWHELFKGSTEEMQKEAANKILAILRDERYVTEDGTWKLSPQQLTMIALYLVLEDKGYLKKVPMSAEELSDTFNKQFHMSFTSRKWRPSSRVEAEAFTELFNLIPEFRPQDYSSQFR